MKRKLIILAVVGLLTASFYQTNDVSSQDLKTACQVLAKLSNTAIGKNEKEKVAIYYNAYMAIKSEHNFTDNCDAYFNEVKAAHGANMGDWSISMTFPPKKNLVPGGGFTHKEIDYMSKLKLMNPSDEDLEHFRFIKELQKDNVEINILKNTKPDGLNIISEKLNALELKNITPAKLNSLSDKKYNVKEFKEAIKQK